MAFCVENFCSCTRPKLVNAHDHFEFYHDLSSGVKTIRTFEICTLVNSTTVNEYIALCKKYSCDNLIKIGFGIHPWKVETTEVLENLESYISNCDFVGEIGLDFFWEKRKNLYALQREVFDYFLQMAKKHDKITNIHTKGAEKEVLQSLQKYNLRTPIVHWYSGELQHIKAFLDLGCYFTIGPDAGYSQLTDELLAILPLDRLLTETDGPTSVEWATHQYAEGNYVLKILAYISQKKRIDIESLKTQIFKNYLHLKI